jgi:hypothetical protein
MLLSQRMSRVWLAVVAAACLIFGACGPAATPLPPTSTAVPAAAPTASAAAIARPATPVFGAFDPNRVSNIKLDDFPVIPAISATARAIYQAALARGHNPRVFSKLGDCMTENPFFLVTFAQGQYDLGQYADLQAVLDHYKGVPARGGAWDKDSFATVGLASASGFNVAAPLDATWADPKWCHGGESPAACEYRVASPSVALIMFGTNDVGLTDAASYDFFLRSLIEQTLDSGVLPLLSTFPTRPENPDKSLLLNQIVVKVAQDYDIPLVNLNRALEPLPNHGVNPADTIHMSVPPDGRVDRFTPDALQYGFTMRNLVTLQALAAVLKATKEE